MVDSEYALKWLATKRSTSDDLPTPARARRGSAGLRRVERVVGGASGRDENVLNRVMVNGGERGER